MTRFAKILTILTILTFAAGAARADYSFTLTCDQPARAGDVDSNAIIYISLINTGANDNYDIILTKNIPDGWFISLCLDTICIGVDSLEWPLPAEDTTMIESDFFPLGIPGDGWGRIKVRSRNNPSDEKVIVFYFTTGYSNLLVCGDPSANYNDYYSDFLNAASIEYNNWPRWLSPMTEEDIAFFNKIIWFTGDAETTLTAEDFSALTGFLENNGDLFLTGQGIAADLQSEPFLSEQLHASFREITALRHVDGIEGDMISEGLSFDISGSGGANNQTEPSSINPVNGSTATLTYSDGTVAGIKYSDGNHQVVFLSFGFEAINDSNTRLELGAVIWQFFDITTGIELVDNPLLPTIVRVIGNYPNPFNAQTTIELENPVNQYVSVSVYDINGRFVDEVYRGMMNGGRHLITWDASGISSGIYFCKVTGSGSKSLPLVLIK